MAYETTRLWHDRTIELFRRVVGEVGACLGYAYPAAMDEHVSAYLLGVQQMPQK